MIIKTLIEYFRNLANRHKNINCYRTGSMSDMNDSDMVYPCLFLVTDFESSFSTETSELDNKFIFMNFKLFLLCKSASPVTTKLLDYINSPGEFTGQDADLDSLYRVMGHIISKFGEDTKSHIGDKMTMLNKCRIKSNSSLGVSSIKGANTQLVDGWQANINIKVVNPFVCSRYHYCRGCKQFLFGFGTVELYYN